jgi:lipoyl synthase
MIRLSAGTAACLGLSSSRMDTFPTTAYLLSGNHCKMSCAFCPQGMGGKESLDRLGRITWPEYKWSVVEKKLSAAAERRVIERICLQSVRHENGIEPLLDSISRIKKASALPLSLSAWIERKNEAEVLFAAGVERMAISIDVANPAAFRQIKGGGLDQRVKLLLQCARRFTNRLSTHLICGLGESEEELLTLADKLLIEKITVALFAFVPLRGTRLEHSLPPSLDSYRRIQVALYLLRNNIIKAGSLKYDQGRLVSTGLSARQLREHLAGGEAFLTSGCPGCNRPYYNERPGGVIYNYHRPLTDKENVAAINAITKTLRFE